MIDEKKAKRMFARIKNDISKDIEQNNFTRGLSRIDCYARCAEGLNSMMRDDYVENKILSISTKLFPTTYVESMETVIVFYDQIGTTKCLALQYLRGFIANGYEVVYVYENPLNEPQKELLEEVSRLCVRTEILSKHSNKEPIKVGSYIIEVIKSVRPKAIFTHSPSYGALCCSILCSISGIKKFRIVPGDHHFYIGYAGIDYFVEFRDYGINYAIDYRGLSVNQLFKLPYYPIIDEFIPFKGLPHISGQRVSLIMAGDAYKFCGSNFIFELSDYILSKYEDVVIYHIGPRFKELVSYISKGGYHSRLIPLGYRNDFSACIRECDILIGSYPIGGGLVPQTAAFYSKPIVSLVDGNGYSLREILGNNADSASISFENKELLFSYVDKLLEDLVFRKSEGIRMHKCLQTKEKFDSLLNEIIIHPELNLKWFRRCKEPLNKQYYMFLQNNFKPTLLYYLIDQYGFSFLLHFLPLMLPLSYLFVNSFIKAQLLRKINRVKEA